MIKTSCDKCGSNHLRVQQSGTRTGLYCSDCNAWLQWLTRKGEIREAYQLLIGKNDIRGRAIKRVIKYGNVTSIRCEKCNCLLYSSNAEKPYGQFDLINACYCPKCGVEFVEEQKNFRR